MERSWDGKNLGLERWRQENDDPGEAHAADDRPEQRGGGVRVLVGTVTRSGSLFLLDFSFGLSEAKKILLFSFGRSRLVLGAVLCFLSCFLSLSWRKFCFNFQFEVSASELSISDGTEGPCLQYACTDPARISSFFLGNREVPRMRERERGYLQYLVGCCSHID